MKSIKKLVENMVFQNIILGVIFFNAIIMGLQTSPMIVSKIGNILLILDTICLFIFIMEIILKLLAYGIRFFIDGWNLFDLLIVMISILSSLSFLTVFRVARIFRVFRSFRAFKGIRSLKLISGLKHLRIIVEAIGKSIPGICWSAVLLLLIYYMFAIMGTDLFGKQFPDWFGSIGASMYTLFQVMTLESWSMGISRPVMEVYGWAWIYFVPFVLIASFIVMNVVVGIVVNAISEVSSIDTDVDYINSAKKNENAENDKLENKKVIQTSLSEKEEIRTEVSEKEEIVQVSEKEEMKKNSEKEVIKTEISKNEINNIREISKEDLKKELAALRESIARIESCLSAEE
ncbi:MAG: ion transporter [Lachnospiraceae bacterium]